MLDTIEDIAAYLGTIEVDRELLHIPMRQARREFMHEYLGRDMCAELEQLQDGEEKLELYKEILASFTMIKAIPRLEARVTSNGVVRVGDGDAGSSPIAFKGQVDKLIQEYENSGFSALDALIGILEEERNTTWLGSDAFKERSHWIVRSAKEFNKLYKMRYPNLLFNRMLSSMLYVQELLLYRDFGKDIISVINASDVHTIKDKDVILKQLKTAVVFLTVAESLNEMRVELHADGLTMAGHSGGAHYNKVQNTAGERAVERQRENLKTKGLGYIESVRIELFKIPEYSKKPVVEEDINKNNKGAFSM